MATLELLTTAYGSFEARVIEARLASEGIDCELRGAVDSPYRLTVGDLARVDVLVPAEQMDDARLVLLVDETDAVMRAAADPGRPTRASRGGTWPLWVVLAVVVVVVAALAPVARYLLAGS